MDSSAKVDKGVIIRGFSTSQSWLNKIAKESTFTIKDKDKKQASDIVDSQIVWNQADLYKDVNVTFSSLIDDDDQGVLHFVATFTTNGAIVEIQEELGGFTTNQKILDDATINANFDVVNKERWLNDFNENEIKWVNPNSKISINIQNVKTSEEEGTLDFNVIFSIKNPSSSISRNRHFSMNCFDHIKKC